MSVQVDFKGSEPECQILLSPALESVTKKKKVFINVSANDVKYFNKNAPVKEISGCVVSEDGSFRTIRKPLHVRFKQRTRNLFNERLFRGRTIVQWIGRSCIWIAFLTLGIALVVIPIYLLVV